MPVQGTDNMERGSSQRSNGASDISFEDDADFERALAEAGHRFTPIKAEGHAEALALPEEGEEDDADLVGAPEEASTSADKQTYMETDAYKPTAFGDFRAYMKNKRLKLKVQEVSMSEDEARAAAGAGESAADVPSLPPLFKGTNIYINGHTIPPYGEMRRLLHLYGGSLMPYLDQKTPVTHIIASNLTAKKRIEFKDYKVVRPEWVTESIKQGKRLDWRDFRCTENASGAMKMGSLGMQPAIAPLSGISTTGRDGAEGEGRQGLPAVEDWRKVAAEGNVGFFDSRPSAGVGPWGKSSRQRTLAGWASKSSEQDGSTDPPLNEVGSEEVQGSASLKQVTRRSPPRSQSEEKWLANLETPPKPSSGKVSRSEVEGEPQKEPTSNDKTFPSLGTDPPSAAAATAAGHHHPSHPYALRPSNIAAAQLLASPSWRQRNTATGDDFLAGFFGKSRLHHLSTWKSEMKEMVSQALREAGKEQGSADLPAGVKRVIMHIDFDAFFVSVGLRNRSDLKDKAVVVCHGTTAGECSNNGSVHSTSEIASCNYIARTFGIRNGMSLGQANRLCDDVHTIPYDFEGYNDIAVKFYTILLLHADAIEAVSIDEALIDVSLLLGEMRADKLSSDIPERQRLMHSYKHIMNSQGQGWSEEKQLAEALRDEIREATGCEASIGIGDNILLARTATRKAKPGGSFHLTIDEFPLFAADLDIDDLHGIGWSIRNRCRDTFGTCKISELIEMKAIKGKLITEFGDKQGVTIWDKLHGRERDRLEAVKLRQSCGASVNYAIRFESEAEAKDFVEKLSVEVSNRLQAIKLVGKVCSISIMVRSKEAPVEAPKFLGHGVCDTFNRSVPFSRPTDDKDTIFAAAWKLLCALKIQPDQLRGIGVSCQKLQVRDSDRSTHRPSGQSMLNFTTPIKDRHAKERKQLGSIKSALTADSKVRFEDDEEALNAGFGDGEDDDKNELEPGPSGSEKRRRSVTPEESREAEQQSRALQRSLATPLSSTQFVIPPASQLDPDVMAALPEKMRMQIERAQGYPKNGSSSSSQHVSTAMGRANSAEPQIQRSQSTVTAASTPEKHRTPVNPFLNMRASSSTPTKRSTRQQGTPYELPRFSQLDQSVLAELPADVREEILREAGATAAFTAKLSPLKGEPAKGSIETPRKRQRYLDLATSSTRPGDGSVGSPTSRLKLDRRMNATDVAISLAANRHTVVAGASAAASASTSPVKPLEPSKVTLEDLIRLEIDVDFFRALPEEVQRETLQAQQALMLDRQARFKSGKQIQELSLIEERRLQRQAAFPPESKMDNIIIFQAKCKNDEEIAQEPNLKGQRSLEEIRRLLDSWFGQFQSAGPRPKDVDRFARFLTECVEVRDLEQLEKARSILKWWASLLDRPSSSSTSSRAQSKRKTHAGWQAAFDDVKGQVNEVVKRQYGAVLCLK